MQTVSSLNKTFLRFLKEENCYISFCEEYEKRTKEPFDSFFKKLGEPRFDNGIMRVIDKALTWSATKEGHAFWHEKCLAWCKFLLINYKYTREEMIYAMRKMEVYVTSYSTDEEKAKTYTKDYLEWLRSFYIEQGYDWDYSE